MKKRTINYLLASLIITSSFSFIPQNALAYALDNANTYKAVTSSEEDSSRCKDKDKDKDKSDCKKDEDKKNDKCIDDKKDKDDHCKKYKKMMVLVLKDCNKKYLSKDQCKIFDDLKKIESDNTNLTEDNKKSIEDLYNTIIKCKLGDKDYDKYKKLMEKKDKKECLTEEEKKELQGYFDTINSEKTSTSNILKKFLR